MREWETNAGAPRYQRLPVAIGDSSPSAAVAIKDAMHDRGVEEVILNSTDRFVRALDNEIVDLLIWDYHISGDDFVQAMQSIRRKEIGLIPFHHDCRHHPQNRTAETVRRLIDAGIDDLIRSPVFLKRSPVREHRQIRAGGDARSWSRMNMSAPPARSPSARRRSR